MNKQSKGHSAAVYTAEGGIIAGLYTALTNLSTAFGLAYGPIQFRISEALTILPVFTPAAIPGLALGCFFSNIGSPYGLADMLLGTLATLLAAICTRLTRNITIKKYPVLSAFMPVIFNCLIVSGEISYFLPKDARVHGFVIGFLQVGAGEIVCATFLGLLLWRALRDRKLFR